MHRPEDEPENTYEYGVRNIFTVVIDFLMKFILFY